MSTSWGLAKTIPGGCGSARAAATWFLGSFLACVRADPMQGLSGGGSCHLRNILG